MINALMDSPFYGLAEREDLQPNLLGSWVTEHTCDLCGKTFTMYCEPERYCYQVHEKRNNHRLLFFCSYHCLRRFQREQPERVQERQGAPRLQWRTSREMALERKVYCEQRIKEYKAVLEAGKTGYERNVARANARNWELKLQEVEAFLDGREIDYDL